MEHHRRVLFDHPRTCLSVCQISKNRTPSITMVKSCVRCSERQPCIKVLFVGGKKKDEVSHYTSVARISWSPRFSCPFEGAGQLLLHSWKCDYQEGTLRLPTVQIKHSEQLVHFVHRTYYPKTIQRSNRYSKSFNVGSRQELLGLTSTWTGNQLSW